MANHSFAAKTCYFLTGAGIGVVVALLLAPKSGKETRKLIADKAEDGKDYVVAKGKELRKQAGEFVERGRETVAKQRGRLAEVLQVG
jgi:gas vesicle protein